MAEKGTMYSAGRVVSLAAPLLLVAGALRLAVSLDVPPGGVVGSGFLAMGVVGLSSRR